MKPLTILLIPLFLTSCASQGMVARKPIKKEHQIDIAGASVFIGTTIILATWKFKTQ